MREKERERERDRDWRAGEEHREERDEGKNRSRGYEKKVMGKSEYSRKENSEFHLKFI